MQETLKGKRGKSALDFIGKYNLFFNHMKKSPRASKSESTKDKILRTAFLLMLERGYDKVLVGDIQRRLGISRGLLYRYYKSKNSLMMDACREFFYGRYFEGVDYDKISLGEFLKHAECAVGRMTDFYGTKIEILKYNSLYSALIQSRPDFKKVAQAEFDKARKVIHNAVLRGEIKDLPENFVGATILAIFGRTSYISEIPSNEYVCRRMIEDVQRFYELIKK